MGRDIAPRVADATGGRLATDCVEFDIDGAGALTASADLQRRATSSDAFQSRQVQIASVRPNTFAAPSGGANKAERIAVAFSEQPGDERQVTKKSFAPVAPRKMWAEASIVVTGGRS